MKKTYSLVKACMTSDMQIFRVNSKKNSRLSILLPFFIAGYLMVMIWGGTSSMFEKLAPMHLQFIFLPASVFSISLMTIIEGIYKSGSLIFNCSDDQLLLSLPIKRRTVLFVRIFKFYVFELLFNSLFLLPIMIAYIKWCDNLSWTYFLTSFIMLILLPIIPIVISCILGVITSSISSRFKYKNVMQIILSMILIIGIMFISFNSEHIFNYLVKHATSLNDLITKVYYPAGAYARLVTNFNIIDLLIFILINLSIFIISIYILSKFYFKINTRLKSVTTTKNKKNNKLVIKSRNKNISLMRKELNTFFKTPVFIVNAGFSLVLFIIAAILISVKYDSIVPILTDSKGLNLSKNLITNNSSILVLILILFAGFMTSITNSVISLEGKNINILKSLPIKVKTILLSKTFFSLLISTPILFIGDMILFIKFKISILESILLLISSITIPLTSNLIGIIVNLKYPKLDAENSTEVVKQSISSFISVMIGMLLCIGSIIVITKVAGNISSILLVLLFDIFFLLIDIALYYYLITKGVKEFNNLSI